MIWQILIKQVLVPVLRDGLLYLVVNHLFKKKKTPDPKTDQESP